MSRTLRLLLLTGSLYFLWVGSAFGKDYPVHIQYERTDTFPLCKKIGATLALSPIRDRRLDQGHVGRYVTPQRTASYLDSIPAPLGKAIEEALAQCFSRKGIKVTLGSRWDGKKESLKSVETDSVLLVEVDRFWTEETNAIGRLNTNTSIYLTIHLGIKKEDTVITRQIFTSKGMIVYPFSPDGVEEIVNRTLADIFDSFLSSVM